MLKAQRRIDVTLGHLTPNACGGQSVEQVDVEYFQNLLEGPHRPTKDAVRELFRRPEFREDYFMPQRQYTEQTQKWCKQIMDAKIVHLKDLRDNPMKFFAWYEALGYFDNSVALKFAVQYNLWGGTILFLGSEKQQQKYLEDSSAGRLPGCFGLTEMAHGSNAQGVETLAVYDKKTQEFVITSPRWEAQKYWPGNMGRYGMVVTVFARLIIDGKDHGVHAFVVPIRAQSGGDLLPGIEMNEIGPKRSFNGVDNCGLLFKGVRIPRENMLERFSSVQPDGTYVCSLTPSQHFASTMSPFLGGRIALALLSLCAVKSGLAIAVNYSAIRTQFGPPNQPEVPILQYTTHLRRLMPGVAACYALDIALKYVARLYTKHLSSNRLVHVHSSGIKAVASWEAVHFLQHARECCGGQGFRMKNRIGQLMADADLYTTGEGDNTVLMIQVSRYLLDQYRDQLKKGSFSGLLAHLQPAKSGVHSWNGKSASDVVRQPDYQQWVLQRVEAIYLKQLHQRMETLTKKDKMTWFDAWNLCLPLIQQLAWAHVHRIIQAEFVTVVKGSPAKGATRRMLSTMCCLYAVQALTRHAAIALAEDVMRKEEVRVLDDVSTHLCLAMHPHARSLVQAFAVPDHLLPLRDKIE